MAASVNSAAEKRTQRFSSLDGVDDARHIPTDLLIEIFKKLPVKSLLRFRCVSKTCLSIIGDRRFISDHMEASRKWSSNPLYVCIDREKRKIYTISRTTSRRREWVAEVKIQLPPALLWGQGTVKTFQSCDGLVLIADRQHACICNPSTRQLITLPEYGIKDLDHSAMFFAGLGFDPKKKRYKVVHFTCVPPTTDVSMYFHNPENYVLECEVLTLGSSSSWRRVDSARHPLPLRLARKLAYANGALYFVMDNVFFKTDSYHVVDEKIVSFCLGDEEFHVNQLPENKLGCIHVAHMDGGECFCVCTFHGDHWALEDPGNNVWLKKGAPPPLSITDKENPLAFVDFSVNSIDRHVESLVRLP